MPDRTRICRQRAIEPGQLLRGWLPATCLVAFAAASFWSVCGRPDVAFLVDESPAWWIDYPMVPSLVARPDGPWRALFHRRFALEKLPVSARLTCKAFKECSVALNGVEIVHSATAELWKTPVAATIRDDSLRLGENDLVVTVACQRGVPALWLALDLGDETIISDERWQASLLGAEVQPAQLTAAVPEFRNGTVPASAERPISSLSLVWPAAICFLLLAAVGVALLHTARARAAKTWLECKGDDLLCAAVAVAWLGMLIWNWQSLGYFLGFDSRWHLDYIEYVSKHRSLPVGTEGPEMWQPPLYYLVAALSTSLFHIPAASHGAAALLRLLSYLLSITQLWLLAACLRRLLPNNIASRTSALFVAGCLPPQIYLMHYNSNDLLAMTLATASLYAAIEVLRSPFALRRTVYLGILLGASVITKLTVWPVVLVIVLVLLWQLAAERRPGREWLARIVVPVVVGGVICGWYFFRNYRNFDGPLPPDQAGFAYGQDLGFAMPVHFVRFGQALVQPFYSAFAGLPDGFYSTLWGDGDWGGEATFDLRPPWNYDLMAATYLLAVVPSVVILTGFVSVFWQVLKCWQPERLLLLGTSVASLLGVAYFYLHHPMYGAVKAHYVLPGIASLCLFVAEGYAAIARQSAWRRTALATALGTWGLASFATYVVLPSSPQSSIRLGRQLIIEGHFERALSECQQALRRHPDNARLRLMEAQLRQEDPSPETSRALADLVLANPKDAEAQVRLAEVFVAAGRDVEAGRLLENAVRLAPDSPDGYRDLALLSLKGNDAERTHRAARAGLRTAPSDPDLHFALAGASQQLGEIDQAIAHYQIAIAFSPEYTPALSALAGVYATHPVARYRSGIKAVEMAKRASQLTGGNDPLVEDNLAAAYAETGDFAKAEQTLRAAIDRLLPSAPRLGERLRRHLHQAQIKQPWRNAALDVRSQAE